MGHEAAAITKAWGDVLAGDATLTGIVSSKIRAGVALDTDVAPYVVGRQRSPGSDEYVYGGNRAYTEPLIDLGIVVEENEHSDAARVGSSRIDDLVGALSDYSVTVDGVTYKISALREGGAWVREEIDKGKKFYWVGGSYRLYVCAA